MKAKDTKEDKLRNEIARLRQRLAELERYEVELKQTDKALRDTETRFRTAIDNLPFDFFVIDKNGRYVVQNAICKERWGDVIGKGPEDVGVDEKTLALWKTNNRRAFAGEVVRGEVAFPVGGQQRLYFNIIAPIHDGNQIQGILGLNIDITEHKHAEEELRESEQRYSSLFKNNHAVMLLIDPESAEIVDANPAACSFYGWSLEEITSMKITDINLLSSEQVFQEMERAKSEERNHFFFRHRLANEEIRDVEVYSGPIKVHGKKLLYSIIHDITDRKQARKQLQQSKELFEKVFATQQDAIYILDGAVPPKILDCNPAASKVFGYSREEMLGRTSSFLHVSEDSMLRFQKHLYSSIAENGSLYTLEYSMKRKDGTVFPTEHSVSELADGQGKRIGWVSVIRDISKKKQVEEDTQQLEVKLLQAKKMEAIATLSGGVAHELENLFQTVQGYVERLLWDRKKDDPSYQELLDITHAALRGSRLTRQLLTFSGGVDGKMQYIDFNQAVKSAQRLLSRTMPENIQLELYLEDDLKIISADPGQMEQILYALVVNAKEAMPDGGKIIVVTESVILDRDFCRTHAEAKPGEYVVLTVSDTGHGIGQETLMHVFDPFYSRKEMEESQGLGLSVVYGVVKNHGGFVSCFSESGEGTTFKVYFPAVDKEVKLAQRIEVEI